MTRRTRSARPAERLDGFGSLAVETAAAVGTVVARNPVMVGGTTAFAITFMYVAANAVWYQPHLHQGALVSTRPQAAPVFQPQAAPAPTPAPARTIVPSSRQDDIRTNSVSPNESAPPANSDVRTVPGDPDVRDVQILLHRLGLYTDEVDGLIGPRTRSAISEYQRVIGVEQTGEVSASLLDELRGIPAAARAREEAAPSAAAIPSSPIPIPPSRGAGTPPQAQTAAVRDERIVRIQAGLRAFGHEAIELDGIVGARTEAAIREFQSLFGLPVTGRPDDRLFAKMREVGLTD